MYQRRLFGLAAAILFSACSSQQSANHQHIAGSPPPLRNPLDFALYPGAAIVSARAFTQTVVVRNPQTGHSIFDAGSGTYKGNEVLAASNASFSDLSSWVDRLALSPPSGYTAIENADNPQAKAQAVTYGMDYVTFKQKTGARTRGVLVVVMDPQRVDQRFGRILGMIAKYRSLPEMMRAPIDAQAKARIGISITDAMQPESPIGAALAALDQFERKNTRGIVVLDAVKQ